MKQAILHFHSGDYLLIELPENTVSVEPSYCHAIIWKDNIGYIETEYPLGDDSPHVIEPVGKLSEVTEEQFARIVQVISNGRISGKPQYRKYNDKTLIPANMWVRCARESFFSKMEAEGLDLDPDRSFLFRILNKQL